MYQIGATRVDMNQFVNDLAAGNPFVWGLVIVFGGLSILGLVQKFRSF